MRKGQLDHLEAGGHTSQSKWAGGMMWAWCDVVAGGHASQSGWACGMIWGWYDVVAVPAVVLVPCAEYRSVYLLDKSGVLVLLPASLSATGTSLRVTDTHLPNKASAFLGRSLASPASLDPRWRPRP